MNRSADDLGAFLHGARAAKGLTLREAARLAGFSARTAGRIERNDGRVRIDKHLSYGEALGVPFRFELAERKVST